MIDVANYRQAEDALVLAEGIAENEHREKSEAGSRFKTCCNRRSAGQPFP